MANILKVTPQEVTEKAKAITSVKSNMENLLTELNSRIKAMTSEDWIALVRCVRVFVPTKKSWLV